MLLSSLGSARTRTSQYPDQNLAARVALVVVAVMMLLAGVFAPRAGASHSDPYSISLLSSSYDPVADTTTFTWTLLGPPTTGASHVVINSCLGGSAVGSGGSPDTSGEFINPDPSTGAVGYKWEQGSDLPVGSTFSLTFDGLVLATGSADWTVKKGPDGHEKDGATVGPLCGLPTPTETVTPTPTPTETVTPPPTLIVAPAVAPTDDPTPPLMTVDEPTPPAMLPDEQTVEPAVIGHEQPEERVLGTRIDAGSPAVQAKVQGSTAEVLPLTGFPLSLMLLAAGGFLSLGLALLQMGRDRGRHSIR